MIPISQDVYVVISVIALCALAYVLYRNVITPLNYFKRLGIPSPPATPFFGHALYINRIGIREAYIRYSQQLGPVYGVMLGRVPEMVISDVDMIKEITIKRFNQFINRPELIDLPKDSPFRDGLQRIRDQQWKRVRSVLGPTFSTAKMRQIITIINSISQNLVDQLKIKCKDDGQVDIWQSFGQSTMQILLAIAFGVESNDPNGSSNITKTASRIAEMPTGILVLLPVFPRFIVQLLLKMNKQLRDDSITLRDITMKVIKSRREQGRSDRKDLLQLMLDAKENDNLTDSEIIAQSILFLVAGYDTTSNTLAFTSYLLALNPDIQDKLINEIDEKCPDETNIDSDTLNSLTYLDMVVDESLRLHPTAFRITREAGEDVTIKNVFIPKGMRITISIIAVHHNPDLWPNPDKFDPERFTPEAKAQRNPCSFMPFGAGPRSCIGVRLALIEVKLILIRVLQHFRLKVVKETPIPLQFCGGFVSSPKDGIRLGLTSRKS